MAALTRMPDDCTLEDMAETLRFLAGVQAGLDELDQGLKIDHHEIKQKLNSWASA